MAVTFQFSRQNGIVSDAIAEFTRAWPSHVDIVWGGSTDLAPTGWLLGARSDVHMVDGKTYPAGVQFRPPGYAPFIKTEQVSLTTTPYTEALFYEFLAAQVGKPYDKIGVAGLALDRDWRSADKWFCSELACAAAENAGIINRLTSPTDFISPRDWLMICEAKGATV